MGLQLLELQLLELQPQVLRLERLELLQRTYQNPRIIHHAKNKIAGQNIPFLVRGFWDENTWIYDGAMPYQREFTASAGIQECKGKEKVMIVPAN